MPEKMQRLAPTHRVVHFVRQTMKARLLVLTVTLLFGGCLAIPHLDQRSPEIAGQILDSTASTPVRNAKVEFIENPALAVFTNDRGEFLIRRTMKPELFVPIGHG